ncbi:TetR/AcrR family transcriptional regulator [Roseomonas sp. BN140053]|uniref:TetR/AcrR family transcriptional regulator n=1 Tax=Roseomonas sp. BN140053 TaxID=3391898 RepID=UPI0039EBC15E
MKKPELQAAIQAAAFALFARQGYTATSMAQIARAAGTTVANLYSYCPSKLALLYAVYRPWLEARLAALEAELGRHRTPRRRLQRLFTGLWEEIPAADNGFANTLIEALAAAPEDTQKPDDLLRHAEAWLARLIRDGLPPDRRAAIPAPMLAHLAWMAFDGFAINRRLGDLRDIPGLARHFSALLLGDAAAEAGGTPAA